MGKWRIRLAVPEWGGGAERVGRRVRWLAGMPGRAWRNPSAWAYVLLALLVAVVGTYWARGSGTPPAGTLPELSPSRNGAGHPPAPAAAAEAPANAMANLPAAPADPAPPVAATIPADPPAPPSPAAGVAAAGPDAGRDSVTVAAGDDAGPVVFRALEWPLSGRREAEFGWVFSETMGDWRWHPGLDVGAEADAQVLAAADGRIAVARRTREWEWEVIVEHGGGLATRYANLRSVAVDVGASIRAGQPLGELGEGGLAEAAGQPHLHFEVLARGRPIDPIGYLK